MVIIAIAAVALRSAFAQTEPTIPPDLLAVLQRDSKTDEMLKECVEEIGAPLSQVDFGGGPLDLGQHHKAWEVFTKSCHGAQNGPHFVYIRVRSGWRKVAEDIGTGFSVCTYKSAIPCKLAGAHGWPDLVLNMHGSAYISTETIYRFDGRKYKAVRSGCWWSPSWSR
jgi:hypothetical protein